VNGIDVDFDPLRLFWAEDFKAVHCIQSTGSNCFFETDAVNLGHWGIVTHFFPS